MPPKEDPEVTALKKEVAEIIEKFQAEQKTAADCTLAEKSEDLADAVKVRLTTKRMLKGHINKVNSVHYADDSR